MATTVNVDELEFVNGDLTTKVGDVVKRLFPKTTSGNVEFTAKDGTKSDLATVIAAIIAELEATATTDNMEKAISDAVSKSLEDLLDGVDGRGDTLKELLALIDENKEVADLLQSAISDKVDKEDGKSLVEDTLIALLSTITEETMTAWGKGEANKLETVKVNGVAQTITGKGVDISTPAITVANSVPEDMKSGDICFVISE